MEEVREIGLGYLTIAWTIFASLAITLSSSIAISKGHVYPYLPSISDTTVLNPEGPIFAVFFNITAFLTVILMSVRYLQLKMLQRRPQLNVICPSFPRLNIASLAFGCVSSLGITLVANFRVSQGDDPSLVVVHDIAAVFLFVGGAIYCWIQSIMTYHLFKIELNSLYLLILRLVCSSLLAIGVAVFFIAEVFAYNEFVESGTTHTVSQWQPEDGGYSLHVLSNMAEWLSVWCFGIFVLTYCKEFQKISIGIQCVAKSQVRKTSKHITRYSSIKSASDEEEESG